MLAPRVTPQTARPRRRPCTLCGADAASVTRPTGGLDAGVGVDAGSVTWPTGGAYSGLRCGASALQPLGVLGLTQPPPRLGQLAFGPLRPDHFESVQHAVGEAVAAVELRLRGQLAEHRARDDRVLVVAEQGVHVLGPVAEPVRRLPDAGLGDLQ